MLEKHTAINTPNVGIITGRDAIHLDTLRFPNLTTLELHGGLNVALCSGLDYANGFVSYSLKFNSVVWLKYTELDFYGLDTGIVEDPNPVVRKSSFDVIENSELIMTFQNGDRSSKISNAHKHFVLSTYDIIFEIVAAKFNLTLGDIEPKSQR